MTTKTAFPGTVRVSVNLPPVDVQVIRDLAKALSIPLTEVGRRALHLEKVIRDEMAAGGTVLIRESDGSMKRLVVP